METLSNSVVLHGFSLALFVWAVAYLVNRGYLFLKGVFS